MLKLYLAGPDVFRPDAVEQGERLKALCTEFGVQGLYPLDHSVPEGIVEPVEQARWIYQANLELIHQADAVLANLNPFRGAEPDSGTAFELGYAAALGKPLFGYIDEGGSCAERLPCEWKGDQPGRDRDGNQIEGFGLPLNLMLGVPAKIAVGGAREALELLREELLS
ncbi:MULTISPECIES: nucleoside 2-deoxyribosyltransferase [Pseudomonas]|uniref:nucleoside 2-deoxyribosyltransferase n=1 Tax=Pseudomonas TaxID=286 RepID=UPI0007EE46EC|nr:MULTISPECIES: nucleoside 2-deoxyribosyltransferase [Pseudomonas]MCJ1878963.1 nucleoside 2-deoxyribosyltransferase [Pseudomonas nitroreducens]MCJ1896223.1 nucleoside 2-deoxyribosyltransferase [Pseudomonas nitroreducens]MDG9852466.1 nucleoside 2-deoxyribosyltransferase [Pseudomonas nitroreducens]NMZ76028.1 nucleoside 2-deoxyribosyltransferase [Pseudomonas nitroreducens]OBY56148.1 nucleoside 2-deoxyribosyltransferase [Pseudomonas sp. AU12215]